MKNWPIVNNNTTFICLWVIVGDKSFPGICIDSKLVEAQLEPARFATSSTVGFGFVVRQYDTLVCNEYLLQLYQSYLSNFPEITLIGTVKQAGFFDKAWEKFEARLATTKCH